MVPGWLGTRLYYCTCPGIGLLSLGLGADVGFCVFLGVALPRWSVLMLLLLCHVIQELPATRFAEGHARAAVCSGFPLAQRVFGEI